MRWFFALLMSSLAIAGQSYGAEQSFGAGQSKPNILFIYADDLGYGELGCYGGTRVPTPNIDSLAAGGMRLTQGYVSAPLCSPSRAGLMTGRYQTRFGHENNTMGKSGGLPLAEQTLADRLKKLGYATSIVGKWHLGGASDRLPMARGFDEYYGVTGNPGSYFTPGGFIDSRISPAVQSVEDKDFYTTDAFAVRACDWIAQHQSSPWFLYLPFNAIHGPHDASEKYLKRFADVQDKGSRHLLAILSAMDDAVGQVLAKLRETGQEDNTLIFFVSDNGAPGHEASGGNGVLRGRKYTCWEGGIRLPFIVQWKGTLPAGKLYEQPAIQLDVMPTCIAAAGGTIDPAWKLDGVNLLPYLSGQQPGLPHETMYWRIDGRWAIRHGDWKLVQGQPARSGDAPELFDLATDVGEKHDVSKEHPEKVAELKALWDAWNHEQAPPSAVKAKNAKKNAKRKARRNKPAEST
ncbi:MAG TPA: sulfatase-like hydrolase/transferase [Pirellulales bacterium]|jgi:arylsulfatase A-like enzyme|nr:sulfatase-like hydrolase/transferase [Pirellulales bacterium]